MDNEYLKELIRTKFDELRQWWKDWNSNAQSEAQLASLPEQIEHFVLQVEYAL